MKIIFGLGHPAHFHLYKHILRLLKPTNGYKIVITDKDILKKLLDEGGFQYHVLAKSRSKEKLYQKLGKLFSSSRNLYRVAKEFKPDLFVGCLSQLAWVAALMRKPCLFNAEDDITYTYLQAFITYPFVTNILTPSVVNTGVFSYKRTGYAGYHKLAYLHPNRFKPDQKIREKYISEKNYFIIRTVNQNAYHDIHAKGLDPDTLRKVISVLSHRGAVYITSENALPPEFEEYRLNIRASDIHHLLYFADLLIADSQSMTVEAAILGTPSIRFNSFANKISVIDELENQYALTHSLKTDRKEELIPLIAAVLDIERDVYRARRKHMLENKIDVTAFLLWYIENYSESRKKLTQHSEFQYTFR